MPALWNSTIVNREERRELDKKIHKDAQAFHLKTTLDARKNSQLCLRSTNNPRGDENIRGVMAEKEAMEGTSR